MVEDSQSALLEQGVDIQALEVLARARVRVFSSRLHRHSETVLIGPKRVLWDTFIYAPIEGAFHAEVAEQSRLVEPGAWVLVQAGQPHSMLNARPLTKVVAIHAHIVMATGVQDPLFFRDSIFQEQDELTWRRFLLRLNHLHQQGYEHLVAEMLRQTLMDVVHRGYEFCYNESAPIDERIREACRRLNSDEKAQIALESLGREVGLSSSQFRLLFREAMGVSPKEYQKRVRLEAAIRDLLNTTMTVQEIADRLTFANLQHFNKSFKAMYGQTPRAYRMT